MTGGSLLLQLLGVIVLLADDHIEEPVDGPDGVGLHVVYSRFVPCLVRQAPEVRQHSGDLVCYICGCGIKGNAPVLKNIHGRILLEEVLEHHSKISVPELSCALATEKGYQELLLLHLFIYTKPTCFKSYIPNIL
jgi:hypothetical protein